MLYTGDEQGCMQKWDLSVLLEKMEASYNIYYEKSTIFVTNPNQKAEAIVFENSDVKLVKTW